MSATAVLVCGPEIAAYGFPGGHPFGTDRHDVFIDELEGSECWGRLDRMSARQASREELEYFHTPRYVDRVAELSRAGRGWLDQGDTPAFPGVFEAASFVVGGTLNALEAIMTGQIPRAFIPIGGLHHAARDSAAGFCVFNDCSVAIEAARQRYGVERVAYVDIDAHHGDGVFYGFEDDPDVIVADLHEDGRFLYPGTGARDETGRGAAVGTKLNLPMLPGSGHDHFLAAWEEIERFVEDQRPQLILLQCGADSLGGDPITHLALTEESHAHAARRLRALADRYCDGRILAMGGGGYNRANLARAWTRVVEALA
ncbi:acetoin utilization protein AcuC [Candidatus Rariloculus sp.]|uniref:acetoin utilization protein AcuC n=1 Tax=Candidatus Rariloculus sp. TaxID=3101265 RepID=UPI003D11734C